MEQQNNNSEVKDFDTLYKSKIEPFVERLEQERIEIVKKVKPYRAVLIILCILFMGEMLSGIVIGKYAILIILITFFPLIILANITSKLENKYKKQIKNKLLPKIYSNFGDLYLADKEIITLKDIKNFGLYKSATKKKDDDILIATYNGINIKITETCLTHTESNGKNSSTVPDFKGIIFQLKMNKQFNSFTVLRQKPMDFDKFISIANSVFEKEGNQSNIVKQIDDFSNSFIGKGLNTVMKMSSSNIQQKIKGLEEVKLEDVKFAQIYEIYSNDQIDARYLITTAFMERLLKLSTTLIIPALDCVFKDNEITFFIHNPLIVNKNNPHNYSVSIGPNSENAGFFEICTDINVPLTNKELYRQVYKEFEALLEIIQYFKLDQKLGL